MTICKVLRVCEAEVNISPCSRLRKTSVQGGLLSVSVNCLHALNSSGAVGIRSWRGICDGTGYVKSKDPPDATPPRVYTEPLLIRNLGSQVDSQPRSQFSPSPWQKTRATMAPPDDSSTPPKPSQPAPESSEAPDADLRPPYAQYLQTLYTQGILSGQLPITTTQPAALAAQAKAKMTPTAYNYVAGGAGEGATMDANRLAFRQWRVVPRMLRPQVVPSGAAAGEPPRSDLRTTLFGRQKLDCPVLMAPIGVQGIVHADKETGLAEVKHPDIGIPTAATHPAAA